MRPCERERCREWAPVLNDWRCPGSSLSDTAGLEAAGIPNQRLAERSGSQHEAGYDLSRPNSELDPTAGLALLARLRLSSALAIMKWGFATTDEKGEAEG